MTKPPLKTGVIILTRICGIRGFILFPRVSLSHGTSRILIGIKTAEQIGATESSLIEFKKIFGVDFRRMLEYINFSRLRQYVNKSSIDVYYYYLK